MRPVLTQRMAEGMRQAWKATTRTPIQAADVEWRTRSVALPVGEHLKIDELRKTLDNTQAKPAERLGAATKLAWAERRAAGRQIDVGCLRLKEVYVLHLPGELFVEYQLAAQALRPQSTVCMAAYGDYGPGYIGTKIAYSQGGYETSPRATNVAPGVEEVLMTAIRELLK
jgi:hypothetical protein